MPLKRVPDLSLYSSGLLIDPRNGGLKKDLSLLFSLDELPPKYEKEPMFYLDKAIGPIWNYAYRYHNWYQRLNVEDNYYYFQTSDFWKEADHQLHDPQDIKYNDLPLPVMAKAQMVFSLWYGMNSYNGQEPEGILRAATPAVRNTRTRGYRPARDAVYRPNPFNGQSKDKIFYIMMTPYLFLNPYNVPIVMDDDLENKEVLSSFSLRHILK